MALPSPKLQFNNGEQCPQFGLGTWLSDKGKVRDAVEHAISGKLQKPEKLAINYNYKVQARNKSVTGILTLPGCMVMKAKSVKRSKLRSTKVGHPQKTLQGLYPKRPILA